MEPPEFVFFLPFHMQCSITAEEVRFTIRMLNDDFVSFRDALTLTFPLRRQ